jgi:hypothetical protein
LNGMIDWISAAKHHACRPLASRPPWTDRTPARRKDKGPRHDAVQ